MTKYKRSDFKSAIDRIRELPEVRRKRIEAGASRILGQIARKAGRPVKSRIKIETTPSVE
jgi:hypothetical protein